MLLPCVSSVSSVVQVFLALTAIAAARADGAIAAPVEALYQQHCAACHGPDRLGAVGPALLPENLERLRKPAAEQVIAAGRHATQMPGFADKLSAEEIKALVAYVYLPLPRTPQWGAEEIERSRVVYHADGSLPNKPVFSADPLNLFVVVETGDHHATILDGDRLEPITRFGTRFALHGGPKFSPDGRYVTFASRDGWISKYDLWNLTMVAEVRAGINTRNAAVSGDGKYVVGGGYWPPHFVIVDAMTMEPLKVVSSRGVNVDGDYVNESRVAAIYDTPNETSWLVSMKELGQMWQVDYSDIDNLRIDKMDTAKFLHDGFFDPTGRYFQIAANASNKMVVVDSKERKREAMIDTDKLPHPGPGANWNDDQCGPVGGTTHLGVGKVTVWGNDPAKHKDQAWKICYEVETDGPGVFIRTHPKSKYVWADQTKHPEPEIQQAVKVIDKKTRKVVKTIRLTEKPGYAAVHMEFNKAGDEVWVSIWNRKDSKEPNGEIVIFDANTLEEKGRVKGLYAPTGKFNVYNRVNHVT